MSNDPTPEQLLLIEEAQKLFTQNYRQQPIVLRRGAGGKVWDVAGRRYLDLTGGIAATPLGHAHLGLAATIAEQAMKLNPRLVYPNDASYGSRGSQSHRAAIHPKPTALSGAGIQQAGDGNPPVDADYQDPCSAHAVASALVRGILARERAGRGPVADQLRQLRALQDLRHHGSVPDHHLGPAARRRRPRLHELLSRRPASHPAVPAAGETLRIAPETAFAAANEQP